MQALAASAELVKRGHDVALLCVPGSTLSREASAAGIPTIGLLGEDRSAFNTIKGLSRLFRSYAYDVVHTHLSHDLWWIVPALKLASSDSKLFLTKHMASGVKKTDPLHRFLYARLQGTFAISNYIRGSVLNTCPVPESEVYILPPGIPMDKFDPALYSRTEIRRSLGIPDDVILIGMVARISPGKGHEEFLMAAKSLTQSSGLNLRFVVVGTSSSSERSYETGIKRMAGELGLGESVDFTGFRRDVPALLSAFDVLAFPSHEESFGLGLAEAMAMELPVVASKSAGVLDIVVDGETGVLIQPKDYRSLAAGIGKLARDPGLRRSYGTAGRNRVERLFSLKSVVDRLESYYAGTPPRG